MAVTKKWPMRERRAAWHRLIRRRNKAVRLVEEMNLRNNRLQPLFDKLVDISGRMDVLQDQIAEAKKVGIVDGRSLEQLRRELRYLMRITFETPATLRRRVQRTAE